MTEIQDWTTCPLPHPPGVECTYCGIGGPLTNEQARQVDARVEAISLTYSNKAAAQRAAGLHAGYRLGLERAARMTCAGCAQDIPAYISEYNGVRCHRSDDAREGVSICKSAAYHEDIARFDETGEVL